MEKHTDIAKHPPPVPVHSPTLRRKNAPALTLCSGSPHAKRDLIRVLRWATTAARAGAAPATAAALPSGSRLCRLDEVLELLVDGRSLGDRHGPLGRSSVLFSPGRHGRGEFRLRAEWRNTQTTERA
eukprot:358313-Chlamydomonas_euryale.AAC.7